MDIYNAKVRTIRYVYAETNQGYFRIAATGGIDQFADDRWGKPARNLDYQEIKALQDRANEEFNKG